MPVTITAIDETPLGNAVGIDVRTLLPDRSSHRATLNMRPRTSLAPAREGMSFDQKERVLTVRRSGSVTHDDIMRIFRPRRDQRRLHGSADFGNGTTNVYIDGDVVDITQDAPDHETYTVTFVSETGYWLSETEHTDTAGVAEPSGNVETQPTLTVSGGDSVERRRYTLLDNTGHGLKGFLWQLSYSGGTAEPTDYDVYMNRRRVPFAVSGAGEIWLRIDVRPRRSDLTVQPTLIDVYHAPGLGNDISAGLLSENGVDLSASSNTALVHDSLEIAQNSGSATGVLRPALQGEISGSGAVMVSQATSELVFQINTSGERVWNAMEILNGVGFGSGVSISGLSRTYSSQSGFHVRYFVRYMDRTGIWQTYEDETTTDSGSASGDISLPSDALQCVIGIDADPSRANLDDENEAAGDLTLSISGSLTVNRESDDLPSVTTSEVIPARAVDGTLTVQPSGERIYLDTLYFDADAEWFMDCASREVDTDVGPWYLADIRRSNPHEWVRLEVGEENTVSAPSGVTVALAWRDRWIDD